MPRVPRNKQHLPEGWDYTSDGLQAWDEEVDKFQSVLFDVWRARTKSRDSRSLDAPDCRDASRFLLTSLPAPRWKLRLRIASGLLIIVAGILIAMALTGQRELNEILLFLIAGLGLAVLTVILQETILRK